MSEAVGLGAGLDDVPAEREPLDDRGTECLGSVKALAHPANDSFEAIATGILSSRFGEDLEE